MSRLDSEIDEPTFQSDFEALAYPALRGHDATATADTGVSDSVDLHGLTRFLETRGLAKAYRIILSRKFVRRIFDDDKRYNVAHDAAVGTVAVLKKKLAAGELTDAGNPVQSLGGLITTIVVGKHRDLEKKGRTVPTAISRLGHGAEDLFFDVAVKGMDLYEAERIAIQRKPGEAAFIRSHVVPAILKTLHNPSRKADYEYHKPRPSEAEILERGSIISGAPHRSPEDELLRTANITVIRRAVEALPSPQREIAEAVYLSDEAPTEKELGRRLGVKDVGYEKKKIKKALAESLVAYFGR